MALVIPPGFAQVAWRFMCDGDSEEMLVTCGVASSANAEGLATLCLTAFESGFDSNEMSSSYTFMGTRVAKGQDGGPPEVGEANTVNEGSANPARFAPNTAILVKKLSGVGGRRNRGRFYLPPLWHDMDDTSGAGVMTESARGGIAAAVDQWFSLLDPVILHDSATPGGATPTQVTSLDVQARLATQRRRLRP